MVDTRNRSRCVLLVIFILTLNFGVHSSDLRFIKHHYFRNINPYRPSFKSHKQNNLDKVNINAPLVTEFTTGRRDGIFKTESNLNKVKSNLKDGEVISYSPGQKSPPFSLWTLNGQIHFPSDTFTNKSLFIHVFNPNSGFLECLWTSDEALTPIINESKENVSFIFIPKTAGINELGNWIPSLLNQWQCVDHNCGLDQVVIQSENSLYPVVEKRHDARYDWLPNPASTFGNKTLQLVLTETGCQATSSVNGSVAMISMDGCSYFQKTLQDMNCNGSECGNQISIPATMIQLSQKTLTNFRIGGLTNITFQNTPSENFFMAIDNNGILSEVGWFLFPSMKFLIWQSQWFDYRAELDQKLSESSKVVKIFENQTLQGANELRTYGKMELDMSLSCPGDKDTTCPHWDHTINLYVCCDKKSPLCGMEFGRWISAFRRRIGRWLTDVTVLLPLLTDQQCTFTMKSVPWAMPWIPSLNLRFSHPQKSGSLYPSEIMVLYEPGATFDKNYNSHFKPKTFTYPDDVKKVEVFAVITGHGSDENGCGEFCVTSHHFVVNKKEYNITFGDAGHLNPSGENTIRYFGYFNGTDPNPHQNPGLIYIYSYLVMYRTH
ncbi:hypothetical protein KUTeg_001917 [Tegillarca granosa]|uniref:Peptide-N-glycosidase F N-terminal domain-containing protein n=1 Tax=Tegillarca granosa TaxID=220873 RepID=A0ABQ9FSY1_TEGGR|nr:hypothetical protein KUTeg_001917 [Tegillarca granosa]